MGIPLSLVFVLYHLCDIGHGYSTITGFCPLPLSMSLFLSECLLSFLPVSLSFLCLSLSPSPPIHLLLSYFLYKIVGIAMHNTNTYGTLSGFNYRFSDHVTNVHKVYHIHPFIDPGSQQSMQSSHFIICALSRTPVLGLI